MNKFVKFSAALWLSLGAAFASASQDSHISGKEPKTPIIQGPASSLIARSCSPTNLRYSSFVALSTMQIAGHLSGAPLAYWSLRQIAGYYLKSSIYRTVVQLERSLIASIESKFLAALVGIDPRIFEQIRYLGYQYPNLRDSFWCLKEFGKEMMIQRTASSVTRGMFANLEHLLTAYRHGDGEDSFILSRSFSNQGRGTGTVALMDTTSESSGVPSTHVDIATAGDSDMEYPLSEEESLTLAEAGTAQANDAGYTTPPSSPRRQTADADADADADATESLIERKAPHSAFRKKLRGKLEKYGVSPNSRKRLDEVGRKIAESPDIFKDTDLWQEEASAQRAAAQSARMHHLRTNQRFGKKRRRKLEKLMTAATLRESLKQEGFTGRETEELFSPEKGVGRLKSPQVAAYALRDWDAFGKFESSKSDEALSPTPPTPPGHEVMLTKTIDINPNPEEKLPVHIMLESYQNKHQTTQLAFPGTPPYRGKPGTRFPRRCDFDWHRQNTAPALLRYIEANLDSFLQHMLENRKLRKFSTEGYAYYASIEQYEDYMVLSYHCFPDD